MEDEGRIKGLVEDEGRRLVENEGRIKGLVEDEGRI